MSGAPETPEDRSLRIARLYAEEKELEAAKTKAQADGDKVRQEQEAEIKALKDVLVAIRDTYQATLSTFE
jgi:hypothetical protein